MQAIILKLQRRTKGQKIRQMQPAAKKIPENAVKWALSGIEKHNICDSIPIDCFARDCHASQADSVQNITGVMRKQIFLQKESANIIRPGLYQTQHWYGRSRIRSFRMKADVLTEKNGSQVLYKNTQNFPPLIF